MNLRAIFKSFEEFRFHEVKYELEQLEYFKEELFKLSKFKKDDYVELAITPEISENVGHGWIGYKDILVKGAKAQVREVDHFHGGFRYDLMFGDKGTFCFKEEELTKERRV